MTTDTLPSITRDLQLAIRAYGLMHGWKNAAKALAFGPTYEAHGNGHKSNGRKANGRTRGRKLPLACIWFENGRLRQEEYPKGTEDLWLKQAHELDATRFTREAPAPFAPARPTTATMLDETDTRLAQYERRECCGSPMGIMESWWGNEVTAVYQCAVDRRHQQETS